jgi:hypothetical protein
MTPEERVAGNAGCMLISDTTAYTSGTTYFYPRDILVIQEDTVIATLTAIDESNTSYNALTRYGFSGKTLKQGAIITMPQRHRITNLTLTSGSLIAY